jgi:hypothetical protein
MITKTLKSYLKNELFGALIQTRQLSSAIRNLRRLPELRMNQ